MTRRDANAYKLHMKEKGMSSNSISDYLGTFSGFWNWAIASGEITSENIWEGLKKGLPPAMKRRPLDIDLLISASEKADELQEIRLFWSLSGTSQGGLLRPSMERHRHV